MCAPPVRTRRRDFARLLKVPRGPDANGFTKRRNPGARQNGRPRGPGKPECEHPEQKSQSHAPTRQQRCRVRHGWRVRRDDARLPRALRRRVCPPDTSAPACNGAGDDTAQTSARETVTSSGNQGPFLDGRVGPKMPTTGVPTAAAMCAGPVSPDTMSLAPRDRATRSRDRRRRRDDRRTRGVSGHFFSQGALSFSPQCDGRQAMTIAQRGSDEAEPRCRPPFVRPRCSRIEQHVADRNSLRLIARATSDSTCSIGNSGFPASIPSGSSRPRLICTTCRVSRGS